MLNNGARRDTSRLRETIVDRPHNFFKSIYRRQRSWIDYNFEKVINRFREWMQFIDTKAIAYAL